MRRTLVGFVFLIFSLLHAAAGYPVPALFFGGVALAFFLGACVERLLECLTS